MRCGCTFGSPSLRLAKEMLLERGIVVSYETVRRWAMKFGRGYARCLKRKQPSRNDVWHLDEVVISIGGIKHWLWRAVDQEAYILDEILQRRRDAKGACRLLVRLRKQQGSPPRRMITDKLGSYAAAQRQIMPSVEHHSHKGLNNRAENSHLPLRRRERAMQGFRSPGGLQRFVSIFSVVRNHFVLPRSRRSAAPAEAGADPPEPLFEQPDRTGSPTDQALHPPHARLQIKDLRRGHSLRHRDGSHDGQTTGEVGLHSKSLARRFCNSRSVTVTSARVSITGPPQICDRTISSQPLLARP